MPEDSGVSQNILRTPKPRKCKSRSVKENAPLLFSPQKVTKTARKASKAKQGADINANLGATSGLRTINQRNLTETTLLRHRKSAQLYPPGVFIWQRVDGSQGDLGLFDMNR